VKCVAEKGRAGDGGGLGIYDTNKQDAVRCRVGRVARILGEGMMRLVRAKRR